MSDEQKVSLLTKPLFVYLRGTNKGLPLKELREAGYVPVPVEDFDSFKVVDPLYSLDGQTDFLRQCAYETLMTDSYPSKDKFAARVLKGLATKAAP